jgi:Fis family transcriptional regulator, factor for inversion stimulation protein
MSETSDSLNAHSENPPVLLSVQVKQALALYFAQLKGHEAADLYNLVIGEVEKPLLEAVMDYCGHNQSKAAKALGLSRSTLRKKLEQYGLV